MSNSSFHHRFFRLAARPGLAALALLTACFPAGANAQVAKQAAPPPASLPPPFAVASATLKDGNDLTALLALRERQAEYTATPDQAWEYWQALAVCESRVGQYTDALQSNNKAQVRSFGKADTPTGAAAKKQEEQAEAKRLAAYKPHDAVSAILEAAQSRRVVMINEAHHVPQHRVFTTRLLAGLYKQGYRWLGAETLNETDTALNRRGYPIRQTGFYTNEPAYGELVRAALRLGYHVVAYEAEGKGEMKPGMSRSDILRAQDERERGQAQNLIQRVFKADPHAKLLVHVGYGHACKREVKGQGFQLMGRHFKQLSGLDALTVDQTYSEADTPQAENPLYRQVADDLTDATVFVRGKECFVRGGVTSDYDMQVFHPRAQGAQGRPDWLENGTGRVVIRVPNAARDAADKAGQALVRAYVPRELTAQAWRAIPADQIVVSKGQPVRALMLAPGAYRLQVWTAKGEVVYDAPLTVAGVPHDVSQENAALRAELRRMVQVDQDIRQRLIPSKFTDKTLAAAMARIDTANTARMRQIIARYGWPGSRLVGREGSHNAFVLLQHADLALDLQRQCLPLLQKAAQANDVALPDVALLTDRVLTAEGKPQRYGSQMMRTLGDEWTLRPTEDETHLDERRRAMDLPPIAEYMQMFKQMYAPKPPESKTQP